jgi:5-enolpyruvylshikimate-3-phosphate synthase
MCAAVAALGADSSVEIINWNAVDVSYPNFEADLSQLRENT